MGVFFNPNTGETGWSSDPPFITNGDDGITSIRWEASDGSLWDMTIDTSGAIVTTQYIPVSPIVGANAALSLLGP